jgi:hypothetical protein
VRGSANWPVRMSYGKRFFPTLIGLLQICWSVGSSSLSVSGSVWVVSLSALSSSSNDGNFVFSVGVGSASPMIPRSSMASLSLGISGSGTL